MNSGSAHRFRGANGLSRRVALVALALGVGPVACFSDVTLPPCLDNGSCAGAPAGGSDGGAGSGSHAHGGAGELGSAGDSAGEAGTAGSAVTPAGDGGTSGDGGGGGEGGEDGTVCPSCFINPEALPAPCSASTVPFETKLNVFGGVAPLTWRIVGPAGSWSVKVDPAGVNGRRAILKGQPVGASKITVEATDSNHEITRQTYDIEPRSACWFAYTANPTGGPELQLRDPILGLPPPIPLAHNTGVHDFKFSPSGRYLVYRYGADATHPKGVHLALVDLTAWTEQVLDFAEQAVTAYAWSPDSHTLAVTFTYAGKTYLGGVKLAPPAAPSNLLPVEAQVDSELYWVGGSYLAFTDTLLLSPSDPTQVLSNPYALKTPFYAALQSNGFAPPVVFNKVAYHPEASLQPANNGFFVIAPITYFYPLPGAALVRHEMHLVSPSGHFSAVLSPDDDGQLQLFSATAGSIPGPEYSAANPHDCPKLLAWAKDQERIACVANVANDPPTTTHGEVRIFDVPANSPTLAASTVIGSCVSPPCTALEYAYTEQNSAAQARVFSASGRWLAFANADNDLYWADLSTSTFVLKGRANYQISGSTASSPNALAFSADEHYVLFQRGDVLIAQELNASDATNSSRVFSDPIIVLAKPCSEDFVSAPDRWCGKADRDVPFRWSSDPRYAAYRSPGKLVVADLTLFPSATTYPLEAVNCDEACDGQFAFQPQP